jgi:hypothetical protein
VLRDADASGRGSEHLDASFSAWRAPARALGRPGAAAARVGAGRGRARGHRGERERGGGLRGRSAPALVLAWGSAGARVWAQVAVAPAGRALIRSGKGGGRVGVHGAGCGRAPG